MNTTNNTTITTNISDTTPKAQQSSTATKTNWMIDIAGILFWIIVFIQFMCVLDNMIDPEFVEFVYQNALPLIGTLAFFGIRKEQIAIQRKQQ